MPLSLNQPEGATTRIFDFAGVLAGTVTTTGGEVRQFRQDVDLMRFLGCVIVCSLPTSALTEAIDSLLEARAFHAEVAPTRPRISAVSIPGRMAEKVERPPLALGPGV